MIKENLLNPKSMFICTSCASFAEENMLSPEQSFLDLVVQKILNGCRTCVDELFGCYKIIEHLAILTLTTFYLQLIPCREVRFLHKRGRPLAVGGDP